MTAGKDMMAVADLTPYEGNPRRIRPDAIQALAQSIERYGFRQPIVVTTDGVVVAGHTRLLAVKELGWDTIWVERAGDLTDEQIREYRLVDNRIAEMTGWDVDLLAAEVDAMMREASETGLPEMIDLVGFAEGELAALSALAAPEGQEDEGDDAQDGPPATSTEDASGAQQERYATLTFFVPREHAAEVKPKIEAVIAPYLTDAPA